MAYKNIVITPQNQSNFTTARSDQYYRGFSTLDPTTTEVKLFDQELIKQDLLNQFNTKKGERLMNPNFGCVIWDLLYEPLTPAVKAQIAADIDRIIANEPRVMPTLVNIIEQDYGFLLELTLVYRDLDVSDSMILSFDKRIGLAG